MTVLSALVLAIALEAPQAAAPKQDPPPPPRLEGSAELSFVSTGGNSETQSLGLGGAIIWRPDPWNTQAKLSFVRSEARGRNRPGTRRVAATGADLLTPSSMSSGASSTWQTNSPGSTTGSPSRAVSATSSSIPAGTSSATDVGLGYAQRISPGG